MGGNREDLPLPEAVTHLLEECRMVLPGIQALFGFQLIVVFNDGLEENLASIEQVIHLCAIGLTGIAVSLVMAPAAFHRQDGPQQVSQDLVSIATTLLVWSMFPLMLSISIDFYLIARIILARQLIALLLSGILLTIFISLWFLLPQSKALRKMLIRNGPGS